MNKMMKVTSPHSVVVRAAAFVESPETEPAVFLVLLLCAVHEVAVASSVITYTYYICAR